MDAALPATPQTLASEKDAMESDDEVQSMASSADMGMMEDEDSSVDFGANDSDGDMDDFNDEDDGGDMFQSQDKLMKPQKKAFEVDFKSYSPDDIQAQQEQQITEVSTLLEQPREATAILLRYGRWNKERVIEQYMDDQEAILEKAGSDRISSGHHLGSKR